MMFAERNTIMDAVVNVTEDWGIGLENRLLVSISADLRRFRKLTEGKNVIMGRKTLDSFPGGRPLKNRLNIVLTRDPTFEREGALVCHSVQEVFDAVKDYNTDDVLVIGGESVYKMFLDLCDTAIVTHVDAVADKADKKFPDLSALPEWKLASKSQIKEDGGFKFRFCEYKREL